MIRHSAVINRPMFRSMVDEQRRGVSNLCLFILIHGPPVGELAHIIRSYKRGKSKVVRGARIYYYAIASIFIYSDSQMIFLTEIIIQSYLMTIPVTDYTDICNTILR